MTPAPRAWSVSVAVARLVSQTISCSSRPAVTSVRPSALKAIAVTGASWRPLAVRSRPVSMSSNRTVPSRAPEGDHAERRVQRGERGGEREAALGTKGGGSRMTVAPAASWSDQPRAGEAEEPRVARPGIPREPPEPVSRPRIEAQQSCVTARRRRPPRR